MYLDEAKMESVKRSKEKETEIQGHLFGNDISSEAQEVILKHDNPKRSKG